MREVHIQLGLPYSKVICGEGLLESLASRYAFPYDNPHIDMGFMNVWYCHRAFRKDGRFLPGIFKDIYTVLTHKGYRVTVDTTRWPKTDRKPINYKGLPLRNYQLQALRACRISSPPQWGIIHAPPRAGKTVIGIKWLADIGVFPAIWVCERLALAEQTRQRLSESLSANIGYIADGNVSITPITVATIQSLSSAVGAKVDVGEKENKLSDDLKVCVTEHLKAAKTLIVDEAHHVAGDSYYQVLKRMISTTYRLGLSGTPWREDNSDVMLAGLLGPIRYRIREETLVSQKFLLKPTTIRVSIPRISHDGRNYSEFYKLAVVENELRNNIIAKFCDIVTDYNYNVLIVVAHIKHAKILHSLIPNAWLLTGQSKENYFENKFDKKDRESVINSIRGGSASNIIISTVLSEGIDIPCLDAVVYAKGGSSSIAFLQAMRHLTPYEGKNPPITLDFDDNSRWMSKHSLTRRRICHKLHDIVTLQPDKLEENLKRIIVSIKQRRGYK